MAFVSSSLLVRHSIFRSSLTSTSTSTSTFGASLSSPSRPASRLSSISMGAVLPVFIDAMEAYKKDFSAFAVKGWGATVKAERWNGRHAMFGFLALVITAYCQGHGLLPEGNLDPTQWGTLGSLGDTAMISNQRAVILVAHVHFLFVSIAAAFAPFSFQDNLLLEPGEKDEEPAGLFPPFQLGLTKGAELWNCRVSMLGLICLIGCSVSTGTPILDVLNVSVGGILF